MFIISAQRCIRSFKAMHAPGISPISPLLAALSEKELSPACNSLSHPVVAALVRRISSPVSLFRSFPQAGRSLNPRTFVQCWYWTGCLSVCGQDVCECVYCGCWQTYSYCIWRTFGTRSVQLRFQSLENCVTLAAASASGLIGSPRHTKDYKHPVAVAVSPASRPCRRLRADDTTAVRNLWNWHR